MIYHIRQPHPFRHRLTRAFISFKVAITGFTDVTFQFRHPTLQVFFTPLRVLEGSFKARFRVASDHLGSARGSIALFEFRYPAPKKVIDKLQFSHAGLQ